MGIRVERTGYSLLLGLKFQAIQRNSSTIAIIIPGYSFLLGINGQIGVCLRSFAGKGSRTAIVLRSELTILLRILSKI